MHCFYSGNEVALIRLGDFCQKPCGNYVHRLLLVAPE